MYTALYRKWRPQRFEDICGQEHITVTLKNELESGRLSHAYLFCGTRGTGKTTTAKLLAKAVNCKASHGIDPCNECESCVSINDGNSIDVYEIDAASNRGIDEIRSIRESIKFAPNFLKYKVLILDEAHQLSKDAANALLKILEEPPSFAIFILATTEAHKMIPTIASRCQRFDFYKLSYDEIIKKLSIICKKEEIEIEEGALKTIASASEGSMRDAEGILNQVLSFLPGVKVKEEDIQVLLGIVKTDVITELTEYLIKKDKAGALKFIGEQIEKGIDLPEFTKALISYLRKLIILKIDANLIESIMPGETKESIAKAIKQSESFDEETLKRTIELLLEAENKSKYASIQQLPLELAIIEAIGI